MMYSVYTVLNLLFYLLELAIIIECIASWIPQSQGYKFIDLVHNFINPILEPLRSLQERLIPGLPIDFSPIIALVILDLIRGIVL